MVLNLSLGEGIACFFAANKAGKAGKAVGVGTTPGAVEEAKRNPERRVQDVARIP